MGSVVGGPVADTARGHECPQSRGSPEEGAMLWAASQARWEEAVRREGAHCGPQTLVAIPHLTSFNPLTAVRAAPHPATGAPLNLSGHIAQRWRDHVCLTRGIRGGWQRGGARLLCLLWLSVSSARGRCGWLVSCRAWLWPPPSRAAWCFPPGEEAGRWWLGGRGAVMLGRALAPACKTRDLGRFLTCWCSVTPGAGHLWGLGSPLY